MAEEEAKSVLLLDSNVEPEDGGGYNESSCLGADGVFGAPPKGEKLFFCPKAPFGDPALEGDWL